jgi:hypothetical protein
MLNPADSRSVQWRPLLCLTALLGVCALSGCDRDTASKSLFDANTAREGANKIIAKLKPPVRALSIQMTPSSLVLQAQDPSKPSHVDSYTYSIPSGTLGRLGVDWVSGPEPVELNLINASLEENLFDLDEVDFSSVAGTVHEAVQRAALEDPGAVTRIRIQRRLYLLPAARSGPVEWSLEIRSGRESAEAFADAKGRIGRMDLSQTRRAQTLDLLSDRPRVMEAFARIREFFGGGGVLKRARISRADVTITARKSGQPPQSAIPYRWNLNGLEVSPGPMVEIPGRESHEEDFFAVDDVDWSKLTNLTAASIEKTGIQGGRVSGIEVERVKSPFAKRPVEWAVTVEPAGGAPFGSDRENGVVFFGAQGDFTRVELPKSRRVSKDFLAVETMRNSLPAFRENFGPEARYMELLFDDRSCRILAPGPKNPDRIQAFSYDQDHFSGMSGLDQTAFYKGFTSDWMFTLDELEKAALPTLAERQNDTLARLGMADGKITRVTFHRHSPFYPGNKKLLIEIRAEGKTGDGYVVYDDGGSALDVIKP